MWQGFRVLVLILSEIWIIIQSFGQVHTDRQKVTYMSPPVHFYEPPVHFYEPTVQNAQVGSITKDLGRIFWFQNLCSIGQLICFRVELLIFPYIMQWNSFHFLFLTSPDSLTKRSCVISIRQSCWSWLTSHTTAYLSLIWHAISFAYYYSVYCRMPGKQGPVKAAARTPTRGHPKTL